MVRGSYFWLFKQSVTSLGTPIPSPRLPLLMQLDHLPPANFFNHWYVNCFRLLGWRDCRCIQITGKEATQQQTQHEIDTMLAAINKNKRFTAGEYNILRLVVAFPLAIDFNSKSLEVQEKLMEDEHALAQLGGTTLTAEFATPP